MVLKGARVAELEDALDLGSSGKTVRVQIPPLAPFKIILRMRKEK